MGLMFGKLRTINRLFDLGRFFILKAFTLLAHTFRSSTINFNEIRINRGSFAPSFNTFKLGYLL
jgi:hypothetical protein